MATFSEKMKAIADAIRAKTGETEKLSLSLIAAKIPTVYDKGYELGLEEGRTEGTSSRFFGDYQPNEVIANASFMFAGRAWNDITFTPIRSLKPKIASYMFNLSAITDLRKILNDRGLTLDFSNATNVNYLFLDASITHLPEINISNATSRVSIFERSQIKEIEGLVLASSYTAELKRPFIKCAQLTTIGYIKGVFCETLSFENSPNLDKKTIINVINALSDKTQGHTVLFNKYAVNRAFATSTNASNGSTSAEWLALIATKPNWTVTLL